MVDSHVHLWDTDLLRYPWLDDVRASPPGRRRRPRAAAEPVAEFVLVQADCTADQALAEIAWLSAQAALLPAVRGIVGYAPLHDPVAAAAHLAALRRFSLVVGVRRLFQDEPPGFLADPGLRAGVAQLAAADLVLDVCVREPQLGEVVDLVRALPEVRFVLDHLGKPQVGADPTRWRRNLAALAELPNVMCKLSGLLTEVVAVPVGPPTSVRTWSTPSEVFGPGRCLYGSDWPVLTLAGSYAEWHDLVLDVVGELPGGPTGRAAGAVLDHNARELYSRGNGDPT